MEAGQPGLDSIVCVARYKVEGVVDSQDLDVVDSSQRTYLDRE